MPELPEVETIARGLNARLAGCVVREVIVREGRSVGGDPELFAAALAGRTVRSVRRRGKLLLLDCDADLILAVHLKMTGRLYVPAPDAVPDKYVRVLVRLDSPRGEPVSLFFHDVRKFGYCRVFQGDELARWPFYATLGPEPLELGPEAFVTQFAGRHARIKALLLDQKRIAGIGNIYADEALFRAGIHPEAPASQLSAMRLTTLHGAVRDVLTEAIAACGSSIRDYRDASGNAGAFQNSFRVYGRASHPCLACANLLERTRVAGRTSTFCPCCQRRDFSSR